MHLILQMGLLLMQVISKQLLKIKHHFFSSLKACSPDLGVLWG